MASPRIITAAEVLAERRQMREELGHVPHGTGRGWSSMLWVSCDCPNCRDEYDPTGEESAKYLNMDYTSFFRGQGEKPSFHFSKIAAESMLAAAKPGFYSGKRTDRLLLDEILPIAIYSPLILHIGEDGIWDEFVPSDDDTWRRRTYKQGRSVWYENNEDQKIPTTDLTKRLKELFA